MKNLFSLLAIAGVMFAATPAAVFALQDQTDSTEVVSTEVVSMEGDSAASDTVVAEPATIEVAESAADIEETREVLSFHQTVKRYFIEGGAAFMSSVLICLILGLALSIERIIYLNLATTNTKKLVEEIDESLEKGSTTLNKVSLYDLVKA